MGIKLKTQYRFCCELSMLDQLVIYHAGCSDGFIAGLIAYQHYSTMTPMPAYAVIAVDVSRLSQEIEQLPPAHKLLSFDLAYSQATFDKLLAKYPTAEVYDHHKSTAETCRCHPQLHFDNDISGCMLAWRYYHGGAIPPAIVLYVQDRDLWTWREPKSRAITAWLYPELKKMFDDRAGFETAKHFLLGNEWLHTAWTCGESILRTDADNIAAIARNHYVKRVGEHNVAIVNSPVYGSELGEKLAATNDYALVWWVERVGDVRVSLRSRKGGADVSAVARRYGGGGHANAAGFTTSLVKFTEMFPV